MNFKDIIIRLFQNSDTEKILNATVGEGKHIIAEEQG